MWNFSVGKFEAIHNCDSIGPNQHPVCILLYGKFLAINFALRHLHFETFRMLKQILNISTAFCILTLTKEIKFWASKIALHVAENWWLGKRSGFKKCPYKKAGWARVISIWIKGTNDANSLLPLLLFALLQDKKIGTYIQVRIKLAKIPQFSKTFNHKCSDAANLLSVHIYILRTHKKQFAQCSHTHFKQSNGRTAIKKLVG